MNAEFYLFDVDHGQCAAFMLPNGKWCVFDVGRSASFSPILWIALRGSSTDQIGMLLAAMANKTYSFKFLKATISHFHGDHFDDFDSLVYYGADEFRTVAYDQEYITDSFDTCANLTSINKLSNFITKLTNNLTTPPLPVRVDQAGIREMSLSPAIARIIGGSANSRVNNASIITRIDVNGNSILICGDMEANAWDYVLSNGSLFSKQWINHVSGIDILIAPHHGHSSGFSTRLLRLANPSVVLVSVKSGDEHVDSGYSGELVRGIRIGDYDHSYISTRQKGHIKVTIDQPTSPGIKSQRSWSFGDNAIG